MPATLDEWPLVGRDEELSVLTDRACVVIAGEPGVGKSRLGRLLLERAAARGARTERITGTRSAAAMPLAAVLALLPDDAGDDDDDLLRLFRRIRRTLVQSVERPFILVDDGHLLDPSSAALVHHLIQSGTVDAAVTVRSNESAPDAITALWRDELAVRLDLQPLGVTDLGTLLAQVLGGRIDDGSASRLWKATGGNPLFLREVVREALGRGELGADDGVWTWTGQVAIGSRLRELVAAPLAELSSEERTVVDLLAVGEELPLALLEHECDLVAVAGARRRGLVVTEGGTARLHHPVLGELVRADLSASERARLSGRLVAAVVATGVPIDRLRLATWHLDAGLAPEPALFTDAAAQALARFDPMLAGQLARAAVAAGGGRPAALVLARSLRDEHRFNEAEPVLDGLADDSLAAGDDAALVAAAALLTDVVYWGQGRPADAVAALERLDRGLGETTRLHLTALRAAIEANAGGIDAALALTVPWATDPSVAVEVRLQAITSVGLALSMSGRPGEALALCDELLGPAAARAREAPRDVGRVLGQRVLALVLSARLDEAETVMAAVHPMAVSDGDDEVQAGAALVLGQIAIERGDIAAADARLREAAVLLRRHDPQRYLPWCLALLARAAGEAGDAPTAAAAADEAEAAAAASPVQVYASQISLGRAWALAAGGELSAARALALAAAERALAAGNRMLALMAMETALRFDAPPGPIAGRLRDLSSACDSPWLPAFTALAAAMAADDGTALDGAASALEAIGARLRAALAYGVAAEAHARAGRRSSATRSRGAATRLLALCPGAAVTPVVDDASAAPVGLTRREREIAGLAATGLSNAEIAVRLGVGVRTVEGHLLRASTKLGVRRRADLGPALRNNARRNA